LHCSLVYRCKGSPAFPVRIAPPPLLTNKPAITSPIAYLDTSSSRRVVAWVWSEHALTKPFQFAYERPQETFLFHLSVYLTLMVLNLPLTVLIAHCFRLGQSTACSPLLFLPSPPSIPHLALLFRPSTGTLSLAFAPKQTSHSLYSGLTLFRLGPLLHTSHLAPIAHKYFQTPLVPIITPPPPGTILLITNSPSLSTCPFSFI